MKGANLALRFLLEIGTLVALGYWGFRVPGGWPVRLLLGLGAPVIAAVVWGTFGSPKAPVPLRGVWRLLLEVAVFGSGAVALWAAGRPQWGLIFAVVLVLNRILMAVWNQ